MSLLEDVAVQLNTAGVGVYPGTGATRTIFLAEMPATPDACIVLYLSLIHISEPTRPY